MEEAEAANRYVAAHAYTARAINRALRAGVRSIEHGNLLDDESLSLFLEHDAFLVPTLVTYWALKEEGREFGLTEDMWAKVDTVLDERARGDRAALTRPASSSSTAPTSSAACSGTRTKSSDSSARSSRPSMPSERRP